MFSAGGEGSSVARKCLTVLGNNNREWARDLGTCIDLGKNIHGVPQGLPSLAQDCTAMAWVTTRVKQRDAQVWKRKWTLERLRFAAEHPGIGLMIEEAPEPELASENRH